MAGFTLSPKLQAAAEEGLLVFLGVEATGFGATSAGVNVGFGFPSGAFTVAALIGGIIAAVRDYQQAP